MPQNSLDLLVPAFRERVQRVLLELAAKGYSPKVHETYRSPARAKALVAKGKSRARGGLSMHCYSIASDIICREHKWSCEEHGCDFFTDLGKAYEDAGLIWGGNWDDDDMPREWREDDLPHGQGVPLRLQNKVRAAKDMDEVAAICAEFLAGR